MIYANLVSILAWEIIFIEIFPPEGFHLGIR